MEQTACRSQLRRNLAIGAARSQILRPWSRSRVAEITSTTPGPRTPGPRTQDPGLWTLDPHALRALDDDGDGEVRGAELRGLALWHDRNRNGVSERGEVRPVTACGIAALSTVYDVDATHPHEIPWSSAGVRFVDGTIRPTFDVVLRRR